MASSSLSMSQILFNLVHSDHLSVAHSLDVVKETSKVVFNAAKLTLGEARLSSTSLKDDIVQKSSEFNFDEDNERVALELPATLPTGSQVKLRLDFAGELTGAMMGYYRSAWEDEGKTKHYTLTQFEVRFCFAPPNLITGLIIMLSRQRRERLSRAGTSRC